MRLVVAVVALVTCVHAGLWSLLQRQHESPDFRGQLASVSYSPYTRSQHPDNGDRPTAEQIRTDLKLLSSYTRTIRTYSSTGGVELVPGIANEFGLKVTIGIWLDKNEARNEREIQAAIALAKRYSNVNAIVVGNETTLRADFAGDEAPLLERAAREGKPLKVVKAERSAERLIKIIHRVKRLSPVPVTTGETWDIWRDHPKLASSVDFIAAHILPYWAGVPGGQVVDETITRYDELRRAPSGQADRYRRVRLAERGLQLPSCSPRPYRAGADHP